MKYGLPIIIIAIALVILGGVYVYRAQNKSNIRSSIINYGSTPGVTGGAFGTTGTSAATPTPIPASLNQITLVITSPANNTTVTTSWVLVSGKTAANADVAVNDTDIKADGSGNFSTSVNLDEGENTIDVIASDANGNTSEQELTVSYTPAQ